MQTDTTPATGSNMIALGLAWIWVGIPLLWGLSITVRNAGALFAK